MNRRIVTLYALLVLIGLFGTSTASAQTGGNDPNPRDEKPMASIPERLAPPPMSDPPTLQESGHYEYYLYCMVCHGDRGQGLTEEWRNAGDPADANCWQSRCHASNYPPGGFELPRFAPPLIGEYALARFATIGDLYGYIQASMPWHLPGLLADEQYRQIALYLADANGVAGLDSDVPWAEILRQAPTGRSAVAQSLASVPVAEGEPSNRNALLTLCGLVLVAAVGMWAHKRGKGPRA